MHNSGATQVARCGGWPCDIVDMVADIAHERAIVVQAHTPDRGQLKSYDVNVISIVVPGAMVHSVANDLRAPLQVGNVSDSRRSCSAHRRGDVTRIRSGTHMNSCSRSDDCSRVRDCRPWTRGGAVIGIAAGRRDVILTSRSICNRNVRAGALGSVGYALSRDGYAGG